ncbi:NAD(P)/FAD-dependent oxidoreductase [Streptomyces sp. URMC 123]|uniref:NAD(P)/FAD-dependent oxidoreductase n=1 Tax=Streptomyces sp. URMC 123 TaxID=3423403 RepID=UPI003F1BA9A6
MRQPRSTHATCPALGRSASRSVVLGGGLTGLLAAAVLAEHGEVTLVERDRFPATAAPRKGLPQARHAHLLWSGGARTIESLLPGVTEAWLAAGAHRVPLPSGLVSLSAQGWLRRFPGTQFLFACSRDLLDYCVARETLTRGGITVREHCEVLGLTGDAHRVTGVRVRDTGTGACERLEAHLVVDATGRGSAAPRWLADLGLPPVREKVVDSGLAYATRIFKAPLGTENYPVVNVQSDPRQPVPGRTATLVPIENGRWLVTLSGTRGGEPSRDPTAFEPFARSIRHPLVADLIADAEPLTDVYTSHSTANRRRYYERMPVWPSGFVALGDAVATYNPIYGHGMSVAAQSADVLREVVCGQGLADPALARTVQAGLARVVGSPWELATGQDILYPGCIGEKPPAAARLLRSYMDRLSRTAISRPAVTRALFDAMTLSAPLTCLLSPRVMTAVLRGPTHAPLSEPPLMAAERVSSPDVPRRAAAEPGGRTAASRARAGGA